MFLINFNFFSLISLFSFWHEKRRCNLMSSFFFCDVNYLQARSNPEVQFFSSNGRVESVHQCAADTSVRTIVFKAQEKHKTIFHKPSFGQQGLQSIPRNLSKNHVKWSNRIQIIPVYVRVHKKVRFLQQIENPGISKQNNWLGKFTLRNIQKNT